MMTGKHFEIDVNELREVLEGEVTLIDVREYAEYAGARVRGSRLVPLGDLADRAREIDRTKPVYLICRTGRRSSEAQRELSALGFAEVVNVRGGLMAWQEAGLPVERDAKAPWALERQVRLVAGLTIVAGVLLSALVAQPFVWLAARVGLGLAYSAVTDSCAMGLLLAKLPWNANYRPGADACPAERAASGD
jgi:rhodanese-related sulfurtransferase